MRFRSEQIIVFLCCLVLLTIEGIAQQNTLKFTQLSTDQGLSTGTVNTVFKDSKGYIWIGTLDGLNRYDGYDIVVYKNDPKDSLSICGNSITTIAEDTDGQIWIGTKSNGISIFNWETGTFTHLKPDGKESSLSSTYVRKILIDEQNRILVATSGGGLDIYDSESNDFDHFRFDPSNPQSIGSNTIFSILEDVPGKFWLGTQSNGIDYFDFDKKKFTHHTYENSPLTARSNRKPLLKDSNGNLWVGTDGDGMYRYDIQNESFELYAPGLQEGGLLSGIVTAFYQTNDGKIYVGTDGKGINVLDPKTNNFTYIQGNLIDQSSLSSDAIYDFYQDDSDVLWVSTFRGGVNVYSKYRSKFQLFQQIPFNDNSLSFNSVIGLLESKDGSIWMGTDGGGLDRLDPVSGKFKHYRNDPRNQNTISGNVIKSLFQDSKGNIWAGTYASGLNRIDFRTGNVKRFLPDPEDPKSLTDRNIWAINEDKDGDLWIGQLGGGLAKYNHRQQNFDLYPAGSEPNTLSNNLISVIFFDSRDQFWVGTEDGGLNLFDKSTGTAKRFMHNPEDASTLLNNNIRNIIEDRNGVLWIATAEGINLMDTKTLRLSRPQVNELLPNKMINGILEDEEGNMWISTNKGLSKYNPESNEIRNFSKADGLQGNEFNYTSSVKTHDGMMYFGGLNGVNAFRPGEIKLSTFDPPVVLTDLRIFDQSIAQTGEFKGRKVFEGSLGQLEKLSLTYEDNVFSLEFASLDYTAPMQNKYRYMLEGFDDEWINVDANKRYASYTNLDPKSYTFRVQATNSDGIWSTKERALEIEVLPAWWATLWFKGLVLILLISSGVWIYRWRIAQIKMNQTNLEKKVEEATAQVLAQNEALKGQQESLQSTIKDTNFVIGEAVESGNFKARIDLEGKEGEWYDLAASINQLFESILMPFEAVNNIVNALAASDLSMRFKDDAKGDVLRLKDNLNHALDNLSELLAEIITQVDVIGNSSQEMSITSEEMNVSTGEIAASIGEMSKGAHDQVNRIDESSRLIEGILKFSNEMSDQARSINEAANRGVDQSDSGKALIEKLDERMKNIIEFSTDTTKSMRLLTDRSREIARVLNIIKEIASETNLLALNAAIEAAKAGDAGKGFAVVAEQIRQLAENSATSAKEIESMVAEVQTAINSTAKLVGDMGNVISGGEEASRNASASFEDLATSYSQTLQLSEGIVKATSQQTEDLRKVVGLMESVVVIAEETASGTEEVASSSSELSAGMGDYNKRTQEVMHIVERLKEKVEQFKLSNDSTV